MSDVSTSKERSSRREWFVWLLIVGLTALIVFRNSGGSSIENSTLRKATARFRAMILIGSVSIQRSLGGPESKLGPLLDAARETEAEAKDPEEKFLAAIIAGEVIGPEPALTALAGISTEGNVELAIDVTTLRSIYSHGPNALSAADKDRLIRRHDDYGRIALAFNVGADEEPRKSVEQKAWRLIMAASVITVGMVVLGAISVALCLTGIALRARNKIHRAYVAARSSDASLLEAFALYLIFMIGLGVVLRLFGFQGVHWNLVILFLVPALLLLVGKQVGSSQQALHAAGWHRGRGWWREVGAGIIGYVAGLAVVVPCLLLAYALMRNSGSSISHPIMTPLLTGNAWQVLGFYGIACIVAPVTEETMFRGILFHHLRGRCGWVISAVLISFIFAIVHPQGWTAVPALGAIALVLAAIREWRGSLIASMTAHALNNFVSLTLALLLLKSGSI
jgi:membrane protease YdiL (CAAX protease family)